MTLSNSAEVSSRLLTLPSVWLLAYVVTKILLVLALLVVFGGSDIRPVDVVYMDF